MAVGSTRWDKGQSTFQTLRERMLLTDAAHCFTAAASLLLPHCCCFASAARCCCCFAAAARCCCFTAAAHCCGCLALCTCLAGRLLAPLHAAWYCSCIIPSHPSTPHHIPPHPFATLHPPRCCSDQRLYVQQLPPGGAPPSEPQPLTAADSKQRFADGVVDAGRSRLVCVVEDHSGGGEAVTSIGAVGER